MSPIENEKIYLKALKAGAKDPRASHGTVDKWVMWEILPLYRDGRLRYILGRGLDAAVEIVGNARDNYKTRRRLRGGLKRGRFRDFHAIQLWRARASEAAMAALENGWGWPGVPACDPVESAGGV